MEVPIQALFRFRGRPEELHSSPDIGAVTHFHQLFFAYTHDHLQGLAEYQYPVNTGPTVWRENLILKLPTSVKVVCSHALVGGWGQLYR